MIRIKFFLKNTLINFIPPSLINLVEQQREYERLINIYNSTNCIYLVIFHILFVAQLREYERLLNIYNSTNCEVSIKHNIQPIELSKAVSCDVKVVERIMNSYIYAKENQKSVSIEYKPGADWAKQLDKERHDYNIAIANKDSEALLTLLKNFFRNEAISGIWGDSDLYKRFCGPIDLRALKRADLMVEQYKVWSEQFPNKDLSELQAPFIGNPWGYELDGYLLFEPVFEYHFQANYLNRMLVNIPSPVVLEIGGGFGGLSYFLKKINSNIKYIGIDLPENILLQSYYLASNYPEAKLFVYDNSFKRLTKEILSDYDIILLPNFTLPLLDSQLADLIINVRSLSEMPMATIQAYFEDIDRIGRYLFFHENIYIRRSDGYHGIPTNEFPILKQFKLLTESESRWPRYQKRSSYPCKEYLFIK